MANRKGFTLVELLIVVSIVAILVALLLPSLGRAKESTRNAMCEAQLRRMWDAFHGSNGSAGSLSFPGWGNWLAHLRSQGALTLVQCPSDKERRADDVTLGNIWLDHHPEYHGEFSNLAEIIFGGKRHGDPSYHQVWMCEPEPGRVFEIRYVYPEISTERDMAHSILVVTIDPDSITLESIYTAHCRASMSGVDVYRGANKEEQLLRLCSGDADSRYDMVDPRSPVKLSCHPGSYAYNKMVAPDASRPGQLLLLDYQMESVADVAAGSAQRTNWYIAEDGGMDFKYLAPRHLGRVNGLLVDGSVRPYWPTQLDPDADIWKP